jgi:oxalate decarboxylase/phosphoglucose isomerase-like protein (cupin superfamily)
VFSKEGKLRQVTGKPGWQIVIPKKWRHRYCQPLLTGITKP